MKKILATLLVSSALGSQAFAGYYQPNTQYFRLDIGYAHSLKAASKSSTHNHYKTKLHKSPIFSIGYGGHLSDEVRADINLSYRNNFKFSDSAPVGSTTLINTESQGIKNYTVMANFYYDIPVDASVKPYLTAGLGYSRISLGKYNTSGLMIGNSYNPTPQSYSGGHSNNFAWQVGAGITADMKENVALDISYRFSDLGRLNSTKTYLGTMKGKLRAHEVLAGLRFKF